MKQVFWTLMIVCGASLVFAAETPRLYRVQQDGKAGFIDARGQIVIPINLPEGTGEFSEGLAPTRGGFGCDYIDETGRMLKIARKFHGVQEFSEGLGAVLNRSRMGYIDRRGKVVIPAQFLLAEPFSEGLAAVRGKREKDGFIDKTGKFVIPAQYQGASSFSEGLAKVSLVLGQYGYIDKTGRIVIPLEYDFGTDCKEGNVFVARDRAWTGLDTNGVAVIRGNFRNCRPFSEGLAGVQVNEPPVRQCQSTSSAWTFAVTSSTRSPGTLQMISARRVRQSSDRT